MILNWDGVALLPVMLPPRHSSVLGEEVLECMLDGCSIDVEFRGLGIVPDDLGLDVGSRANVQAHQRHTNSRDPTFLLEGAEVDIVSGLLEQQMETSGLGFPSDLARAPIGRDI